MAKSSARGSRRRSAGEGSAEPSDDPATHASASGARDPAERQRFAKNAVGDAWQDSVGLVFTDAVGRPLLPEYVSHRFARECKAAGIPRIRFHDLRHTAATTLLAAGVPLAVISEWLGHSGITVTAAAYAAVVPDLLSDAAEAMDRALGGAS